MQKLIIKGKKKLSGSINISGSKNATLPILAATVLTDRSVTLKNIPLVQDVYTMINLLKFIGLDIEILKKKKYFKHFKY
jgi:UDP-N-acetylglucosamine 1-carboxyvinyltransferase